MDYWRSHLQNRVMIHTLRFRALASIVLMVLAYGASGCATYSVDPTKRINHTGNWFTGSVFSQGDKVMNRGDMVGKLLVDSQTHDLAQKHLIWSGVASGSGLIGVGLCVGAIVTVVNSTPGTIPPAYWGFMGGALGALVFEYVSYAIADNALVDAVSVYNQRFHALIDGQNWGGAVSWRF